MNLIFCERKKRMIQHWYCMYQYLYKCNKILHFKNEYCPVGCLAGCHWDSKILMCNPNVYSLGLVWPRRGEVIRKHINSAPSVSYLIDMRCPRLSQNPSVGKKKKKRTADKVKFRHARGVWFRQNYNKSWSFILTSTVADTHTKACKIRIKHQLYNTV